MTAHNDLDRQLNDFLRDGPTELPYESFDAVRDRTEQTGQRVVLGPWRLPEMNKILTIGLGAAAVVVALFIGAQLFGSPNAVGGPDEPTASPQPTPNQEPSVEPSTAAPSPIVWLDGSDGGLPITITPAPGWNPEGNFFAIEKNGWSDPPDGAAILAFANGTAWSVPGDPCHAESTLPDTPSGTVDELVDALSAQASHDASAPVDITVDGHAGKSITLQVPDPWPADCESDHFCTFVDPTLTNPLPADNCARNAHGPGLIDELWIVDVDGTLVIIDAAYWEGTPDETVEEMRAIVDSISFELP